MGTSIWDKLKAYWSADSEPELEVGGTYMEMFGAYNIACTVYEGRVDFSITIPPLTNEHMSGSIIKGRGFTYAYKDLTSEEERQLLRGRVQEIAGMVGKEQVKTMWHRLQAWFVRNWYCGYEMDTVPRVTLPPLKAGQKYTITVGQPTLFNGLEVKADEVLTVTTDGHKITKKEQQ